MIAAGIIYILNNSRGHYLSHHVENNNTFHISIFFFKELYFTTIFDFSDLPRLKMPHKKTTKKERNRWLSKLIEVEQKLLEWSFEKDLSLLVQDGKNYS